MTKDAENTFPKFAKFACVGDTIQWEKEGFSFAATLTADNDTSVKDYDCYDEDQIKAWYEDEWFYVGVVLSVSRNGIMIEEHAASIWGVECNFPDADNSYLSEVAQDMESEALDRAIIQRDVMIKALQE